MAKNPALKFLRMAPAGFYIPFQRSSIHYLRWGEGPEWLFCFHGYGEDAGSFAFLPDTLGERFTIIAIDLPFHGRTDWQEELQFTPEQLVGLIHQIKPADQPMHLLGYSMGGRVVLQLLGMIPGEIRKILLVAPDGLHRNPWQKIATQTRMGNRLFYWLMKHPLPMLAPLDLAAKAGLYNRNLLRFIHYYLDDAGQRTLLYKRWTTLRLFRADTGKLAAILQTYAIPVNLLFGKYDRVILSRHGHAFREKAGELIQVTEIDAGHQLLREKHRAIISELLVQ